MRPIRLFGSSSAYNWNAMVGVRLVLIQINNLNQFKAFGSYEESP